MYTVTLTDNNGVTHVTTYRNLNDATKFVYNCRSYSHIVSATISRTKKWERWIYFYDRKNKYYPRFDSIDELLTFLETYNYGVLTCQK